VKACSRSCISVRPGGSADGAGGSDHGATSTLRSGESDNPTARSMHGVR
jgi:hypothetical protein